MGVALTVTLLPPRPSPIGPLQGRGKEEVSSSEDASRVASGSKYLREETRVPNLGCVHLFLTSIPSDSDCFEMWIFVSVLRRQKVVRGSLRHCGGRGEPHYGA